MKIFFVLGLWIASLPAFSQSTALSDKAQISIITLGPDQKEFYEAFGHSAIRVFDPVMGIDHVFNYGVFSFDQPNFYLNFTKGHLYYKLGVNSYPDFRDAYIYYNRFVHEQVLNLTRAQNEKVFAYLLWNAQPKNQTYNYDYFFNNCSTKIRDVFADVLKGEIQFDGSFIHTTYTIRQLERLYLDYQPWGDVGINIGLGLPIDRTATPYEYMYLPDYLESFFDHALIKINGVSVPVVKEKIIVYQSKPEQPEINFLSPWKVFGFTLALALALSLVDWKRKKLSAWFDILLFSVTGLLGCMLLFLWLFTDHHACVNNFNLLWALPTNLVTAVMLLKKRRPSILNAYFRFATLLSIVLLVTWAVLPQQLSAFLIPLVLALTVRYFMNWGMQRQV